MYTYEQLCYIIQPVPSKSRIQELYPYIDPCCYEFRIDTTLQQAAFIAQIAHESGKFQWFEELASGRAYEGREDLGNIYEGDGVKFKGRGVIQLTGRYNYEKYSAFAYGNDYLVQYPALVAQLPDAMRVAGWFWYEHGLNELAEVQDFEAITRRINGGLNGYDERVHYYHRALEVIQ